MAKLAVIPLISPREREVKIERLANSLVNKGLKNPKILFPSNSDALHTARELELKLIESAEGDYLVRNEQSEVLAQGSDAIANYLRSMADRILNEPTRGAKTHLILITEQEVADSFPTYFWRNVLKAEFGGIPALKEGQAVLFNYALIYLRGFSGDCFCELLP